MVAGNVGAGIFLFLPLVFVGAVAVPRSSARCAGLSTAIYDPAARGYITDATPPERRGEAFGLYGAAQMGGLLLGPAIGGARAGALRRVRVRLRLRRDQLVPRGGSRSRSASARTAGPGVAASAVRRRLDRVPARAVLAGRPSERPSTTPTVAARPAGRPGSANRLLVAAILLNIGGNFAAGTYEVIWTLFLEGLGAELELIGLTFAMFGLPVLVLSPYRSAGASTAAGSSGSSSSADPAPAVAGLALHR